MTIIKAIDGGGQPNDMADIVRKQTKALPHTMEYIANVAKLQRHKFASLVSEGFTEAQALELCKGPLL